MKPTRTIIVLLVWPMLIFALASISSALMLWLLPDCEPNFYNLTGCVIAGKSWAAWLLLGAYGGGIFSIVFAVVYTIIRIATLLIHRKASRL
jgi:hypothetical protein